LKLLSLEYWLGELISAYHVAEGYEDCNIVIETSSGKYFCKFFCKNSAW